MDYVPITRTDREEMLRRIGAGSLEELLRAIPSAIPAARMVLPPPLSEPELLRLTADLAALNATPETHSCFLGAGSYRHFIPSVVRYITSRGEFLTAYTPYQPEASQGTLQAMYEYQSVLCDLTGMDVANASLYEGASAVAEACILAMRETGRSEIVLAGSLHPEYRQTVHTYLKRTAAKIHELPASAEGSLTRRLDAPASEGVVAVSDARARIDSNTAAVVVQVPNQFGCLESADALAELAHAAGALFIVAVNPISLGILRAPGSYGADIVVGEGQPLGTDLQYGGPYLGLFACRQALLRKVPGRIVGMTRDAHNRRGFVLTLQTREQHIRRAKATSNICTNEAMMAVAATVYLGSLGKDGFRQLALQNLHKAHYAFDRLTKLHGVTPLFSQPFFNEFALQLPCDPEAVNRRLLEEKILGGFPLKRWDPTLQNGWLVCVTEANTREEIDRFVDATKRALR